MRWKYHNRPELFKKSKQSHTQCNYPKWAGSVTWCLTQEKKQDLNSQISYRGIEEYVCFPSVCIYVVLEFSSTKGFIEHLAPLSDLWKQKKPKTSEQRFVIKSLNLTNHNYDLLEMMKRMTFFLACSWTLNWSYNKKRTPQGSYTSELQFSQLFN